MTRQDLLRAALIALLAASCDRIDRSDRPAGEVPVERAVALEPASDPEIAHLLQTASALTMRRATLARGRAENPEVRAFADTLAAAHSQFDAVTIRLLLATNTVPVNGERSKSLVANANEIYRELNQKSGAAFDVAYVDHELAFHEQFLALMDSALLPVVRGADLRAEVERARPMFAAHLEAARRLRPNLR